MIASPDGYLYLYALNLDEGGDCSLIRQFQLADFKGGDEVVEKRSSDDVDGKQDN